jgi:23S rRNA-/tRNA-specific pseudouridylate synthase
MSDNIPAKPAHAFRIKLSLDFPEDRMDNILLDALRNQDQNLLLKNISRSALKSLFNEKQILIKGQRAKSNSALAKGETYVDILGFDQESK